MGTWSEDKLKSLRSQYNFEKRAWPNAKPEVPQECELDSRGILQWKGGKRPVVHSGYWVDPKSRAKDSTFKPGDHVVIQAGYGGKGGQAGQDFKRFSSDTPAIVTDIAGGDIYVRPEGDNYKWKVQAKALVEGTARASARDADRRSRLHRALDAVMDSCGSRSGARDASGRPPAALKLDSEYEDVCVDIANAQEDLEGVSSDLNHGRGTTADQRSWARQEKAIEKELDKLEKKKTAIEQKAKAAKIVLKKPRW